LKEIKFCLTVPYPIFHKKQMKTCYEEQNRLQPLQLLEIIKHYFDEEVKRKVFTITKHSDLLIAEQY